MSLLKKVLLRIVLLRVTPLLLLPCQLLADNPQVQLKTSAGDIVLELDAAKAPLSVANFLAYVDDGSYAGTIFHRVIPGFMVQGGGMRLDMSEIADRPPVANEADNGLKNLEGTVAFARTNVIDSATNQFFINVGDNSNLDHGPGSCTREAEQAQLAARAKGLRKPVTCTTFGYAVFGRVVTGMDVVRQIENAETGYVGVYADVPLVPVVLESVTRVQ